MQIIYFLIMSVNKQLQLPLRQLPFRGSLDALNVSVAFFHGLKEGKTNSIVLMSTIKCHCL